MTAPQGAPASQADFAGGPPLGSEPPADPNVPGAGYLATLHERIHPRWAETFLEELRTQLPPDNPLNREMGLLVVVDIAVASDGTVHDVLLQRSSGFEAFNQAAIQVIEDAAPFAPPPAGLQSDDGYVHVTWTLARDVRQCSPAGAAIAMEEAPLGKAIGILVARGDVEAVAGRIAKQAHGTAAEDAVTTLALAILGQAIGDADPEVQLRGLAQVRHCSKAEAAVLASAIIKALGDEQASVRAAAARAVTALYAAKQPIFTHPAQDGEAMHALQQLLGDGEGDVVAAAAGALAAMGAARLAVSRLGPGLSASDPTTQAAAAAAVAEVGDPALAGPLTAILASRSTVAAASRARAAAAHALGTLPTALALRPLEHALADTDAGVREQAALSIGELRAPGRAAYFALADHMMDPSEAVRIAATASAVGIDPADGVGELFTVLKDPSPSLHRAVARSLAGATGADALSLLRRELESKDSATREAAATALADRDDGEPVLAKLTSDPDAVVRGAALSSVADVAAGTDVLDKGGPAATLAGALRALARCGHRADAATPFAVALAARPRNEQIDLAGTWLSTERSNGRLATGAGW